MMSVKPYVQLCGSLKPLCHVALKHFKLASLDLDAQWNMKMPSPL